MKRLFLLSFLTVMACVPGEVKPVKLKTVVVTCPLNATMVNVDTITDVRSASYGSSSLNIYRGQGGGIVSLPQQEYPTTCIYKVIE